MIKSWSYKYEYKLLRNKILKNIDSSLRSGNIFFGSQLKSFEYNFSRNNNIPYGVAVGSGTDAILISLLAIGIKKGDEVITVSNTAIATVSAIVSAGGIPKFVDVNQDYLMNLDELEKK